MGNESTVGTLLAAGPFTDKRASASAVADLVDWARIQELTDTLYDATGIPSAIVDLDGIVLTGSGWQPICTGFHRVNPITRERCIASDTILSDRAKTVKGYSMYCCPQGLVDCVTPLIVEGDHVANVFTGQFLLEPPDIERFRKQAAELAFDEDAYLTALAVVPIVEERQAEAYLRFLARLAEQIGEMVLAGLRQDEALRSQRETELELRDSEARYRRLIETANEGVIVVDEDGVLLLANAKMCTMLGSTAEALLGTLWTDLMCPEDAARFPSRFQQRRLGLSDDYELTLLPAGGGELPVRLAASPIVEEGGRFAGAIAMVTDISAQREAERWRAAALKKMRRTLKRQHDTIEATVVALARTAELRDPYTSGHQERVAALAAAIAEKLHLPRRRIVALSIAATIHDLGKMSVPAEILSKPGPIGDAEHRLIEQHPAAGYQILRDVPFQDPVADIVHEHHERLDGSGYPRGLAGDEIRFESRILGVADVVEAMSAHRPYRPALGIEAALEEILAKRDVLYDAEVVDACVWLFREDGFTLS